MIKTTLEVGGMTCGGCARSVANALRSMPSVHDARVELATRTVTVEHSEPDLRALVRSVEAAGFTARLL